MQKAPVSTDIIWYNLELIGALVLFRLKTIILLPVL